MTFNNTVMVISQLRGVVIFWRIFVREVWISRLSKNVLNTHTNMLEDRRSLKQNTTNKKKNKLPIQKINKIKEHSWKYILFLGQLPQPNTNTK